MGADNGIWYRQLPIIRHFDHTTLSLRSQNRWKGSTGAGGANYQIAPINKVLTIADFLTPKFDLQVKCHFGNRVILKAWTIVILSSLVASFKQKNAIKNFSKHISWGWPADYIV